MVLVACTRLSPRSLSRKKTALRPTNRPFAGEALFRYLEIPYTCREDLLDGALISHQRQAEQVFSGKFTHRCASEYQILQQIASKVELLAKLSAQQKTIIFPVSSKRKCSSNNTVKLCS
jgi:hypothetical protein